MIRRLTSRFGRDRKQDGEVNGVSPQTNGVNGKRKSFTTTNKPKEVEDHSTGRVEIESTFAKYAQIIHASNQPLPTQYVFIFSIPAPCLCAIARSATNFRDFPNLKNFPPTA